METGLAKIPDRDIALKEIETRFALAVKQRELLENYIRERLKPEKHFYVVAGGESQKNSLTKEGAELICLPHNLKPRYAIISGPENPPLDDSPYQITVNCELMNGETSGGQGLGSASSMITKKNNERVQRQKDPGLRHNATLKMACKSAYIAATLNSTAASEFFTQDMEDIQATIGEIIPDKKEHWCSEHNTAFFKSSKMKSWAHPIKNAEGIITGWCGEKPKPKSDPTPSQDAPGSPQTAPAVSTDQAVIAAIAAMEKTVEQAQEKPKRDPATITNFGKLYYACDKDFSLSRADVWKELNVKAESEITDKPSDCFIKIAAARQ